MMAPAELPKFVDPKVTGAVVLTCDAVSAPRLLTLERLAGSVSVLVLMLPREVIVFLRDPRLALLLAVMSLIEVSPVKAPVKSTSRAVILPKDVILAPTS